MSHDPEDWCKICRKTNLFQKWQEFHEIWCEHSKSLKNVFSKMFLLCKIFRVHDTLKIETLIRSFNLKWKKYELKIYRRVMYHGNEKWSKIW